MSMARLYQDSTSQHPLMTKRLPHTAREPPKETEIEQGAERRGTRNVLRGREQQCLGLGLVLAVGTC